MNWLLMGFVLIVLINLFFGFKNGLWNATVTLVTLLLIMFMMNMIMPSIITNMNIKDESILESTLSEEKDLDYLIGFLPQQIQTKILQGYSSYDEVMENDEQLAYMISGKLASFGVIIAMFVGLIVGLFVLRPISAIHDYLLKIPFVKHFDKVLGMGVGFINAMIMIYMCCIGILIYSSTTAGACLYKMIYQSNILKLLYENNFLLKMFF